MDIKLAGVRPKKSKRGKYLKAAKPRVGSFVEPRLRYLEPGTPDYVERERLLRVMRDEQRPQSERAQAAMEALPQCYVQPAPIVTVSQTTQPKRTRTG